MPTDLALLVTTKDNDSLELCIQVGQLETTVVSRLVLFPVVSGVFFAILLWKVYGLPLTKCDLVNN